MGLYRLLVQHGGAVESDLQRYYRTDLRDLGSPRLTWRRLGVLLYHLPRESATVHATLGAVAEWSTTEHLLASVVDTLRVANWQRSGRRNARRPEMVQRPGSAAKPAKFGGKRTWTIAELEARLAARAARTDGKSHVKTIT